MITLTLLVLAPLLVVNAFTKAIRDSLLTGDSWFRRRFGPKFWGTPEETSGNKYKHGIPELGPRFPFSTTLLVGFTDGYHLMELINFLSWGMGFTFAIVILTDLPNIIFPIAYVILWGVHRLTFQQTFNLLRNE